MKTCSKCKATKELSLFYKRGNGTGLPSSWCKDCSRKGTEANWKARVASGLCKCGRERKIGYMRCAFCVAYSTQRYGRRKDVLKKHNRKVRNDVLDNYGGKCNCCGETEKIFLQLHHVNKDGGKHRKSVGGNSAIVYWARKNNYPPTLELLCANCHMGVTAIGYCPHRKLLSAVA